MKLTNAQISQAMTRLGLTPNDFRAVEQAPSFEASKQVLAALKDRVKKSFRKVALDLHPDRTNNDPAKTEEFKLLATVVEDIEKLALRPPQPQPVMRVVFVRMNVSQGFSTTSTSSTTTGFGW